MNLHKMVSVSLNAVNPMQDIIIKMYVAKIKNDNCDWVAEYEDVPATARVELENNQNLQHINGLDLTLIYKRFFISTKTLTGLNRNLGSGGDYIQLKNLFYKIVKVEDNFNTGWFCVVGCESSQMEE